MALETHEGRYLTDFREPMKPIPARTCQLIRTSTTQLGRSAEALVSAQVHQNLPSRDPEPNFKTISARENPDETRDQNHPPWNNPPYSCEQPLSMGPGSQLTRRLGHGVRVGNHAKHPTRRPRVSPRRKKPDRCGPGCRPPAAHVEVYLRVCTHHHHPPSGTAGIRLRHPNGVGNV